MDTVFKFIGRCLWCWRRARGSASVFRGLSLYDIHLVGQELCALLDEHPAARWVMADLAHLERTLRLLGPDAVDALAPHRLRWALSQLLLLGLRSWEGPIAYLAAGLKGATQHRAAAECLPGSAT